MITFEEKAKDFLAQRRIAIAGVSRSGSATGNAIFQRLRDEGYDVFILHPTAASVEGHPAYQSVGQIPGSVDGALLITSPEVTERVVDDCIQAGVPRVWMHENGFFSSGSSVSHLATVRCQEAGVTVIDGGCPLMFLEFGHKCMRWMLRVAGRLPA